MNSAGIRRLLAKYSQVFPVGSAGARMPHVLQNRRRRHLRRLDSFAIFSGVPQEPGAENLWHMNGVRIYQEPSVHYLTGINQPKPILVLDPGGKPEEILFLPEKDPKREFWDGVRFGYLSGSSRGRRPQEDAAALTGIQDIRPLPEFPEFYRSLVLRSRKRHHYSFFHEYKIDTGTRVSVRRARNDHNARFLKYLKGLSRLACKNSGGRKPPEIRSLAQLHFSLRLPLDTYQVRDARSAARKTGMAFAETLSRLSEFRTEHELGCYLEYRLKMRSTSGLSFPTIVAGGRNATILHYLKNDEKLRKGELVLLDFGVRCGTMHADVSRTVPLNGRFNPLQALLYKIVLDAVELNEKHVRRGATIRGLNERVWEFIENRLRSDLLRKGGWAKRDYQKEPHGVSHLMGEQEHDGDPYRLYQDAPLENGWQLSNEPGLYGEFQIDYQGTRYRERLGIRIEDNLLVRGGGCENLAAGIPKSISRIERMVG